MELRNLAGHKSSYLAELTVSAKLELKLPRLYFEKLNTLTARSWDLAPTGPGGHVTIRSDFALYDVITHL